MVARTTRFDDGERRPRLDAVSGGQETRVQRFAYALMRLANVGAAGALCARLRLPAAVRSGDGLWLLPHRAAVLSGGTALLALAVVVFWKYIVLSGSPDGFQRWRVRMPRTIRVLTIATVLFFVCETVAFLPRYGVAAVPLFGYLFFAWMCLLAFV